MRYWEIVEAGRRDAEQPDHNTERKRWKRYWQMQMRISRALASDAEKRSKDLPAGTASICRSAPAYDQPTGLPF